MPLTTLKRFALLALWTTQFLPVFRPLRNQQFCFLWVATLFSNLGSWMQTMGAAWLMLQLNASPKMTALIQTAMTFPVFLLVIPAGLLADRYDRRTILLLTQIIMVLIALGLSSLISLGDINASLLLAGVFLLGCGVAVKMPIWQAAISSLVEPQDIQNAALLNGMSFNFSRSVGPALAGGLAFFGCMASIFWMNSLFLMGLAFAFLKWRLADKTCNTSLPKPPKSLKLADFKLILQTKNLRPLLLRVFLIFFGASCLWSLFPAFAALSLQMSSSFIGSLLGMIGLGGVIGGHLLPYLRHKWGIDRVTRLAAVILGAMLLLISFSQNRLFLWPVMMMAGVGWVFAVSGLNGVMQSMFPSALRARAISVYLMAMYAGSTAGSLSWGVLSTNETMRGSFASAGLILIICGIALKCWPIS